MTLYSIYFLTHQKKVSQTSIFDLIIPYQICVHNKVDIQRFKPWIGQTVHFVCFSSLCRPTFNISDTDVLKPCSENIAIISRKFYIVEIGLFGQFWWNKRRIYARFYSNGNLVMYFFIELKRFHDFILFNLITIALIKFP